MDISKDERNKTISLIRSCALWSVMLCHIMERIYVDRNASILVRIVGNYFATGVQVFLIISGYLYGLKYENKSKDNNVEYVLKNLWKILKDYYLYLVIVAFPVCLIFDRSVLTFKNIVGAISTWCTFGRNNHLWFIPYILICYIISPALARIREWMRDRNELLLLVLLCSLYIAISYIFKSYFIPEWLVCYIFGFFMADLKKMKIWNKWGWFIAVVVCICINILRIWLMYFKYPDDLYTEGAFFDLVRMIYRWAQVILAILFFVGVLYLCEAKKSWSKVVSDYLSLSDRFSYGIYLCHMIFVNGYLSLLGITSHLSLNILMTVLASIILGVALTFLSNKTHIKGNMHESG